MQFVNKNFLSGHYRISYENAFMIVAIYMPKQKIARWSPKINRNKYVCDSCACRKRWLGIFVTIYLCRPWRSKYFRSSLYPYLLLFLFFFVIVSSSPSLRPSSFFSFASFLSSCWRYFWHLCEAYWSIVSRLVMFSYIHKSN